MREDAPLYLQKSPHPRGFTLIEIIVSLTLAAILGIMLLQFLGSPLVQSGNALVLAQNGARINKIMENMTSDYRHLMATSASPLTTFITRVGPEGTEQSYYSDPQHPYLIVNNRRIAFPSGSPALEESDPSGKTLRVTIRYRGLTITALFTE
jgi:prepilin-type N-terminal cleavage/methylation domain-containing protein